MNEYFIDSDIFYTKNRSKSNLLNHPSPFANGCGGFRHFEVVLTNGLKNEPQNEPIWPLNDGSTIIEYDELNT
jgi:hypothetical protein